MDVGTQKGVVDDLEDQRETFDELATTDLRVTVTDGEGARMMTTTR